MELHQGEFVLIAIRIINAICKKKKKIIFVFLLNLFYLDV